MEYFRKEILPFVSCGKEGLNPCCNGILSKDYKVMEELLFDNVVLILVVMEYFRKN